MTPTAENLTQATHGLEFARGDLLEALKKSDPVEAIVIQQLIEQLMPVLNRTKELLSAMEAKE